MDKSNKSQQPALVRSSAAEYLTFVAASGTGGVEAVYADENVWLTQKMMGVLYGVETHTINYHLKKIFSDSELQEDSVVQNFRITAADGKNYDTKHYSLAVIIAVGYKVNSERAVQFRKWATTIIESFTIKGFASEFVAANVSEYMRDLIRRDMARKDQEAFERLKAELNHAFVAPDAAYQQLTAADVIARNLEFFGESPSPDN